MKTHIQIMQEMAGLLEVLAGAIPDDLYTSSGFAATQKENEDYLDQWAKAAAIEAGHADGEEELPF